MLEFDYLDFNELLTTLKPMKYKLEEKSYKEILAEGKYMGYHFIIVSYGVHPCAYVEIPEGHPYFGKDNVNLPVHGGITWKDFFAPALQEDLVPGEHCWYLGWDYNHFGDYSAYNELYGFLLEDKQWTTLEIFEQDVCPAIKELVRVASEAVSEKTND